ncbi:hypothetical protein Tco_1070141 [Tanacetum coccineum]|uniref:Uncharacterized protein n=1 Tax=Tanacetum coccineum TaxID=301880 RepID=A0ABQ5HLX4_9ASTR
MGTCSRRVSFGLQDFKRGYRRFRREFFLAGNTHLKKFDLGKIWIPEVVELSGCSSYAPEIRKEQHNIDGDLLKEYTDQKHQTANGRDNGCGKLNMQAKQKDVEEAQQKSFVRMKQQYKETKGDKRDLMGRRDFYRAVPTSASLGETGKSSFDNTTASPLSYANSRRHCSLPPVQTAAPYLLCRLLLLTSCADCCSLPPVQTAAPYLLCRHYFLVIASRPEVTFIIPAIPVFGDSPGGESRSEGLGDSSRGRSQSEVVGSYNEGALIICRGSILIVCCRGGLIVYRRGVLVVCRGGILIVCRGGVLRSWGGSVLISTFDDSELEALVASYDIPLVLRPRLPDPNFRMINLTVEDTTIGIYQRILTHRVLGLFFPPSS